MLRKFSLACAVALLILPGATVWGQYYGQYGGYWGWGGWGATPQGDIARGMGAFARGVGVYNVTTAQANAINADTMMRWNSYIWAAQNSLNREHYARMLHERAQNKAALDAIAARIRDNPTEVDIERGDALNAILEQLSDPRVHPSALRMTRVPLDNKWIQNIPFRYASEAVTLSLHNLTAKQGWPLALRGQEFASEREAYEKAIDAALKQDKQGDLTPDTIANVNKAIMNLRTKVESTVDKNSREYIQAENFLKSLAGMAAMLKRPQVDRVLASLEKYPGTTVADLLGFMQMYNLRFGAAETPEERELYRKLYPLLDEQRDAIIKQMGSQVANTAPTPPPGAPPTEIFHRMPWERLAPQSGATPKSSRP